MVPLRWAKILLLLATFACLSCSHGSTEGTNPLTGSAGAKDALIWLDLDGNFALDPGDPTARTTPFGDFSLHPPKDLPAGDIFVLIRIEAGETRTGDGRLSSYTYLLAAPAGDRDVSIWTTLVAAMMVDGQAAGITESQQKIRAAFELPDDFGFSVLNESGFEGLSQVVESAFAQRSAEWRLRSDASPKVVMVSAAREVIDLAPLLLEVADGQSSAPEPPLLKSPRPVESGVFHADFAALPINSNMAYGIGLDEASYALKGVCTEDLLHFDGFCANDYAYAFDLVENVHELSKNLAIGASAKAGVSAAGFDVVSVSGGFKFLRDTEFKDNTLYILFSLEQKLCGYPTAPALKPEWAKEFENNYETFRDSCGDRYLSSITSGGRFVGLMEVMADENIKIEDLRLSLSGKVLGATVYKKTWKETLSEIDRDYTTHTRVLSNRFAYSNNYLSVAEVFALFDDFVAKTKRAECSGSDGWQECGYIATFSRYEAISDRPPGNVAAVRARLANMQALESYYFECADLLASVDEILIHPDDYNIGASVDGFTRPNDWTLEELMKWQDEVAGYQSLATRDWEICRHNIQECTENLEALELPSWLELKMELPTRKFLYPESCKSLAEQFGVTDDGVRRLFLGGNVAKNYRAYCQDMSTSTPKTYLPLFNHSANVTAPTYNFSSLHYTASDGAKGVITRTFSALLIEPRTDLSTGNRYLHVLSGQRDSTDWGAEPILEGDGQLLLAESIGVLQAQGQGGSTATANLNLEGTPFIVLPSLEIEGGGAFTDLFFPVSAGGRNIDVAVTNGTATAKGGILLEWDKDAPHNSKPNSGGTR